MKLIGENKSELIKFLKSNNLMTLSTASPKPWVAIVYYAFDRDFNFYFVSSPNSEHSKHIEKNGIVACAIYDSHTKNSESKSGVQMTGTAVQVRGWERTRKMLAVWHKSAPGMEDVVNIRNMKEKVISSRVYKIKVDYIKFFNEKYYGDDEYGEFRL